LSTFSESNENRENHYEWRCWLHSHWTTNMQKICMFWLQKKYSKTCKYLLNWIKILIKYWKLGKRSLQWKLRWKCIEFGAEWIFIVGPFEIFKSDEKFFIRLSFSKLSFDLLTGLNQFKVCKNDFENLFTFWASH